MRIFLVFYIVRLHAVLTDRLGLVGWELAQRGFGEY